MEDVQIKAILFLNVSIFQNQTVDEFLYYLENEQHISLSSHTVSVRTSNLPKDFPHFTITPLMTPLCQAIDVFYNALIADAQYTLFVGSEVTPRQAIMKKFMRGLVLDYNTGLFKVGLLSPVIFNKTYEPVEYLSHLQRS